MRIKIACAVIILAATQSPGQGQVPRPGNAAKPPPTATAPQTGRQRTGEKPDLVNRLPDLQIAEMKLNENACIVHVRVANRGGADAAPFIVWVNFVGVEGQGRYSFLLLNAALPPGGEGKWMAFSARLTTTSTALGGVKECLLDKVIRVQAIADARFEWTPDAFRSIGGKLLGPGQPVSRAGNIIEESRVAESKEDNNGLVVNKADMKPWP